jgi:TM2 domain-containing membrane protein YozV
MAGQWGDRSLSLGGYNPPPLPYWQPPIQAYPSPPKSRTAYILLGIFLGIFGVHNFYAGYTGRGAIQLSITISTLFFGAIVSWIWAIVEVCIVDRDSQNVYMV